LEDTALYLPPVLRLISENTIRMGNPLGIKEKDCRDWMRGLAIPTSGKTVLYAGCEYQMAARVQSLVEVIKKFKFDDAAFSAVRGLQSVTGRVGVDIVGGYTRLAGADVRAYNAIVRQAAVILRKMNVNFACLEREIYSGALLYEYGLLEDFERQAKTVAAQLKEAGAERIITLTPHSAEVFRDVYPRFVSGFNFEVVTYPVALAGAMERSDICLHLKEPLTLTLHDPCHLARTLKVTEEPREILRRIDNLELMEAEHSHAATVCCGAPCEAIYPELSEALATRRAAELAATGASTAAAICPFCLTNLTRGARLAGITMKVVDLVEIVHEAIGGEDA
jgi:Fe-S oxidoreductase